MAIKRSAARCWHCCWLPSLVFCLALANHGGQAGIPFLMWAWAFWSLPPKKCTAVLPLQVSNPWSLSHFLFSVSYFSLYCWLDGSPCQLRSVLHLSSSTAKLLALSFFFRLQKLLTCSSHSLICPLAFHSIPIPTAIPIPVAAATATETVIPFSLVSVANSFVFSVHFTYT